MLFGEYVTTIWWPAWKPPIPLHPRHQEQAHRPDPPPLRRPPLAQLDAHAIAAWQRDMTREGLSPRTIATYLSLLGTICNAAVDDGHLDHSPLTASGRRRRPAALTTPARPSQPRLIWLTRPQVDQLADAIDSRYRA